MWALEHSGLVAPQHVASSRTRDLTGVACLARQILHHWTTRETLRASFNLFLPPLWHTGWWLAQLWDVPGLT